MLRVFFSLGFPKLSFAQYLFGRLEIKEIHDKKKKKRTWLIHVVESRTALREGRGFKLQIRQTLRVVK